VTIATAVLAWWQRSSVRVERDRLAWRAADRDPWAILVSEVMLAQTQVGRVAERYEAFLERYPDPASMASSPLGDVVRDWAGLGYPRRAVGLHRASGVLVAEHEGHVPARLDALLALPGVGRYTARAVAAFAFDQRVLPVDTNIGRVLARATGSSLTTGAAQAVGDSLSEATQAGGRQTAQAFMDLGAALCRPAAPRCDECPLGQSGICAWRAARRAAARSGVAPPADPATGSAAVARRQLRFEGSDRQGRGSLLRAAAEGPIPVSGLGAAAAWPDDQARAERAAASLVRDGLLVALPSGEYVLPP